MYSVRHNSHWSRAVVVSMSEGRLQLRLVDLGKFVDVPATDVRNVPARFLAEPGLSIWCHLAGILLADVILPAGATSEVMEKLPGSKMVDMVKRGGCIPVDGQGYYSQPVDFLWTRTIIPGPFAPSQEISYSLTSIVLEKMGAQDNLDAELDHLGAPVETEPESELEEFQDVLPLEDVSGFRWLPPEFPRKSVFRAVGTFVDQSGQIYVQYYSKKIPVKPVMVIKQLLDEKFRNSSHDESRGGPLQEGQECCVLWLDSSWYRARIIKLIEDDTAVVFLVDFGNLYRAKVENIRPEVFAQNIPIQALTVELAGVRPMGPGDTWTETALEVIQRSIENRKVYVEVVDDTRKPPSVNIKIKVKSSDVENLDLGYILSALDGNHVKLGKLQPNTICICLLSSVTVDDFKPSKALMELRENLVGGIEAVPAGTYQETNPYVLIQSSSSPSLSPSERVDSINHLDWAETGLQPGDRLRVRVVDVENFNTVFLHPADPSCPYLGESVSCQLSVLNAVFVCSS